MSNKISPVAITLIIAGTLVAGTGSALVEALPIKTVGLIVVTGLIVCLAGTLIHSKNIDQ